jgi:signal transduction histidine kinase
VLEQIVEIWSDAADITISLPEQLEREISGQPLTSEALIEISREFINNAIKHGHAEKVSLRVFRVDQYRLGVEVTDDGQGVPPGAKPGFGSKLLTELSFAWRQSRLLDKTVSYAEIVLGQEN